MNLPRLLPLIGVSLAGVLAVNALAGARDLPAMLSAARAYAEGTGTPVAKGGKPDKPDKPATAAKPMAASPLPPSGSGAAPAPAGVCAPGAAELAKAAGLSPGELQQLQNLQVRRGQIDQQAKDLDTQSQLLVAAEAKLDTKLKAMADLKGQIEALMGQADQKTQAEVDRLVTVMAKMDKKVAGPLMATLDDKVRVPLAAKLKEGKLADILANMPTPEAKKLTELLAHRFAPVQALADAARNPPAAQPAPPTKPDPKAAKAAKPAQTAEAAPEPGDANVDDPAAKPAKPKPVKVARRAAPKKKPAYHAPKTPAVEQAKATASAPPLTPVKDTPAAAKPAAAVAAPTPAPAPAPAPAAAATAAAKT